MRVLALLCFLPTVAHAYIARKGICVDIHASHWPYADGSDTIVSDIVTSVSAVE